MNLFRNCCIFSTLLTCNLVLVAPVSAAQYWQCSASDAQNKVWSAAGNFRKSARNNAFAACKKESAVPLSCKPSSSDCLPPQEARSSNMWRCSALDMQANVWRGNYSAGRDRAALGAKSFCKRSSMLPDTCYINWFSCTHLQDA